MDNQLSISSVTVKEKLMNYVQLSKVRLSLLVVFSSAMSYIWATDRHVLPITIWMLSIGGFLITASSNTFNQLIEANSDKLMKRTSSRPLPTGKMSAFNASVFGVVTGIAGLFVLSQINNQVLLLGVIAMLTYILMYTPLKKITAFSIVPGAIAGSLPVIIGVVAAKGEITKEAIILFTIQFIWQFPHTWSIAWLLNDEYNKAGIKLMPTRNGRTHLAAFMILFSTFLIIPAGFLLYMYASAGIPVVSLLSIAGLLLFFSAFYLFKHKTEKSALRLMFSSFIYLPFILFVLVVERFL